MDGEVPGQMDEFCSISIPLFAKGIFHLNENFLNYMLPRVLLQLVIIFLLTQSIHIFFKRYLFQQPRIVSEILAGFILGQSFFGKVFPKVEAVLFPEDGDTFIELFTKLGVIFYFFLMGVKMDPSLVLKTGLKAWTVGLMAVALPVAISKSLSAQNMTAEEYNKAPYTFKYRFVAANNILAILTLTSFPVIAALLIDLRIMNTELGRLALAASLIADLFSQSIYIFVNNIKIVFQASMNSLALKTFGSCIATILSFIFIMRPIFLWIIRKTPEGKPVKPAHISLVCFLVLLAAIFGNAAGLQYYLGPFILGLCVPDGPPLGSTLVVKLETLSSGLFAPLLLTYSYMKLDLGLISDLSFAAKVAKFFYLGAVGKFMSTFLPALIFVPMRDAFVLAFVMSHQGITQISLYTDYFFNQTIDNDAFVVIGTGVLFVAMLTSVLARVTYDYSRIYSGYQKRNIENSDNTELRVLACAHREDDALAAIKLIEASSPIKESPIAIYAVNLVELTGRATPLIINHKLGQKGGSAGPGGSRSQQMIDIFTRFETQHSEVVSAQVFTAISLSKFMYHDICSVAFDKSTSLIILPFHKKWNAQGKVVFDSGVVRQVNKEVLENAPCSVCILIDRRKVRSETSDESVERQNRHFVAVIFLGGDDDREALAYGRRMSRNSGVHLTVVRLVARDEFTDQKHWDTVLDTEALKAVRIQAAQQSNITYREEKVKDGPETALIVNEVQEAFDLVIVGRGHKDDSPLLGGLSEWSEMPELGPLGDILATADVKRPVSVLVVQQQIMKLKR